MSNLCVGILPYIPIVFTCKIRLPLFQTSPLYLSVIIDLTGISRARCAAGFCHGYGTCEDAAIEEPSGKYIMACPARFLRAPVPLERSVDESHAPQKQVLDSIYAVGSMGSP